MACTKILARGWDIYINTGTIAVPTWTTIGGLSSLTFSNSKNDADTTTYDSQGNMEHIVASRSREVSIEGLYLEDVDTGARDAGQEAVDEAGVSFGCSSLAQFKLTSPYGAITIFLASINIGDVGGGNDDPTSWGATLTISGAIDTVAVTGIVVLPETLALAVAEISDIPTATFTPANASDKSLTYASSNNAVAVVTTEGRIIGITAGTATITVTAVGGVAVTDTIAVTVS
jgi:uncharacterized protein YjdB